MPVENLAPGWWQWALLVPSLAALIALLGRGLVPEVPRVAPARWTALHVIVVVLVHLMVSISMMRLVEIPFLPTIWKVGISYTISDAITCLVVLFAASRSGSIDALGLTPPRKVRNLAAVAAACLAFQVPLAVVSWAWILFLSSLGHRPELQPALGLYIDACGRGDWTGVALIGAGAAVFAPLAEELLFRGLIFGLFKKRLGPTAAVVLASALFALIHLLPEVIFPIFLVGLVLNWVYLRTGSLAYTILFHMLFNAGTLALASFEGLR